MIWILSFMALLNPSAHATHDSCEIMLEVFDDGVEPPFAWGHKLMELLSSGSADRLKRREGPRFYIQTSNANVLLNIVSDLPLVRVERNGEPIPVYDHRYNGISETTEFRKTMYGVLAHLPEGRYLLNKESLEVGREYYTMFVEHKLSHRMPSSVSIFPEITIWSGNLLVPEAGESLGERHIGTYLPNDAESYSAKFENDLLTISHSLPHAHGGNIMVIHIQENVEDGLPIRSVTIGDGILYEVTSFYPLKVRRNR